MPQTLLFARRFAAALVALSSLGLSAAPKVTTPFTSLDVSHAAPDEKKDKPAFNFSDFWTVDQKLDGKRQHKKEPVSDMSGSKVQDIAGTTMTINSPDKGGGGNVRREWVLEIDGNKVTVKDIRLTGNSGATFEEVRGTGRIDADTIKFTYSYRIKSGVSGVGSGSVALKKVKE